MKFIISFLLLLSFFISGCSIKINQAKLDNAKSCYGLNYELESINSEINKIKHIKKKKVNFFHYAVVSWGILASIPLMQTNGFYIVPAMTITYYNNFIGYDQSTKKLAYLQERNETISNKIRSKNCKKSH